MSQVTVSEVLSLLKSKKAQLTSNPGPSDYSYAFLDVRSEQEWQDGSLPFFCNVPILNNSERHQVGLTYKQKGQPAAISLGHELVDPHREELVLKWKGLVHNPTQNLVVTCWRGGLRSKTACQWLKDQGVLTLRLEGGFKAARNELLSVFQSLPPLLILSGLTGSGKTRLLKQAHIKKIDLEAYAHHRGSSFGKLYDTPQPSQVTFENRVALDLWKETSPILLEDESVTIGAVGLPADLKNKMKISPVVFLETPLIKRALFIAEEYVLEPRDKGYSLERIRDTLIRDLSGIEKKLGGLRFSEIKNLVTSIFASKDPWDPQAHVQWISPLLSEYYDKLYNHAWSRQEREVIFKGDADECLEFLKNYPNNQPAGI